MSAPPLARTNWEIVWSPAHEVGVREPFGTLVAEVDNPELVGHMTNLNGVTYRSGFWKVTRYDRGDKETLASGRESNQRNAIVRAAEALAELLDRRI